MFSDHLQKNFTGMSTVKVYKITSFIEKKASVAKMSVYFYVLQTETGESGQKHQYCYLFYIFTTLDVSLDFYYIVWHVQLFIIYIFFLLRIPETSKLE